MSQPPMEGRIHISKVHSSHGPDYITVELIDKTSGVRFVQVSVSPEAFVTALFSGNGEMEYDVRGLDVIGKRHEHQTVKIEGLTSETWQFRDSLIQATQVRLGGGWKAEDVGERFNTHRADHKAGTYAVSFHRYVEP